MRKDKQAIEQNEDLKELMTLAFGGNFPDSYWQLMTDAAFAVHTYITKLEEQTKEYDALVAAVRAGNALEISGRNRGYGKLPLMDLWMNLRNKLDVLPKHLLRKQEKTMFVNELGSVVSLQMALLGMIAGADPKNVGLIALYKELLGWTDDIKERLDGYDASFALYDTAVRKGTRHWQNVPENLSTIWPDTAKLVSYMADETDILAVVKKIMEQPWDDSNDKGVNQAFRRLANISNALNMNGDPDDHETENTPSD